MRMPNEMREPLQSAPRAPAGGGCRRSRLGVININRTTHPRNRQFPSKQLPGYLIAILNSSREAVFRSQPVLD